MTDKPKTEKKEPTLRVYPVTPKGEDTRYIEASTPAQALEFAFQPHIGSPLNANDLLVLFRTHPKGIAAVEIIPK